MVAARKESSKGAEQKKVTEVAAIHPNGNVKRLESRAQSFTEYEEQFADENELNPEEEDDETHF